MPLHAIILAAGRSERMGCPKYALSDVSGQSFLASLAGALIRYGCAPIIVVMDIEGSAWYKNHIQDETARLTLVVNPQPHLGRNSSLQLGLCAMTDAEAVFVLNVDNPMADPEVLDALKKGLPEGGYARPVLDNRGGHPILISADMARSLPPILKQSGDMRQSLSRFPRRDVCVKHPGVLLNINTPEDYKKYVRQSSG